MSNSQSRPLERHFRCHPTCTRLGHAAESARQMQPLPVVRRQELLVRSGGTGRTYMILLSGPCCPSAAELSCVVACGARPSYKAFARLPQRVYALLASAPASWEIPTGLPTSREQEKGPSCFLHARHTPQPRRISTSPCSRPLEPPASFAQSRRRVYSLRAFAPGCILPFGAGGAWWRDDSGCSCGPKYLLNAGSTRFRPRGHEGAP
jgi:hypothetical protein